MRRRLLIGLGASFLSLSSVLVFISSKTYNGSIRGRNADHVSHYMASILALKGLSPQRHARRRDGG